jgi:hypothetical protein
MLFLHTVSSTSFLLSLNADIVVIASHVCFFAFICEMKKPEEFPKALAVLQFTDMTIYIVSSIVIYIYAGQNVASPALRSAIPLMSKIAYGLAIPTVSNFQLHSNRTNS